MPGPNGNDASIDRFPNVDLPATDEPASAQENLRYIDEALEHMQADDVDSVQDDTIRQPQPQYPQPVRSQPQPGARQQQQRQQPQPQQQRQPQPQSQQLQPTQAQAQLTDEQRLERRAQEDPFAVQADLLQQQESNYVEALAKQTYAISPEDMDAFLSGDSSKVSQALARVHVNAVGSVMRVVSQQMPVWIGHMLKIRDAANEAEQGFWDANPGLNRRQHRDAANKIAVAYRQMNPQATPEDIYQAVGAMVATMFKVNNVQQQDPRGNGNGPLPRTPGRVVRRVPQAFSPSGAQPSGQQAAIVENPWSQISEIMRADESGLLDNVR